MKNKIILYILSFLGVFAFSCSDELMTDRTGESGEEADGLTISLKVDVPDTRTRAIDMTPGGALYLNNIWIGVYNKNNGNRVVSDSVNLHSRLTASGTTLTDIIKLAVNQNIDNTYGNDYCVVGVANYYGIQTTDDNNKDLIEALKAADNWSKFSNISISTQQEFPNQTPVLMGYLTKKTADESKHTVIDQFIGTDKVNLANQTDVFVTGTTQTSWGTTTLKGLETKDYVLNLRRLRSKININLIPRDDQMTITNLEYKIVNVPKSSFLAERKTNTMNNANQSGSGYSPNSPDVKNEGYITLDEAEWQKTTDNYSFSYEHVENKHWSTKDFSGVSVETISDFYHTRGEQSEGVFTSLASSKNDWNNNASYIILKINLRDFTTGRNSLIEYTILEGFCNDADGKSQVDADGKTSGSMTTRLQDFSCFRNTDYNYNIHIESVDKIYVTVTDGKDHPNDQHNGSIWQMLYPEFKESNLVSKDKRITTSEDAKLTFQTPIDCTKDDEGEELVFEDIAFRLVGTFYDENREEKVPVDLCYNVAHGELDGFSGLWIDPVTGVTEYFVDTTGEDSEGNQTGSTAYEAMESYFSESHPDEETMLKRFTVKADDSKDYNIKEFIEKLKKEEVKQITGVNVNGIRLYETADESDGPRNHMIGLYVFDRQRSIEGGNRVKSDAINDCHYYQIRAIEQYPAYLSKATYEPINAVSNNGYMSSRGGTTPQINNGYNNVNGGKNMIFSENPDIAFRLLGYYDKDGSNAYEGYYDICYNFDMNEYPYFNDYMPAATYDTRTVSKNALSRENIPNELLEGIKIQEGDNGQTYTIKQFISRVLAGNVSKTPDYRFVFEEYKKPYYKNDDNGAEKDASIRGIYIFDKKNRYKQPELYNSTTNEATYQIYLAEQEGVYVPPVELPNPNKSKITYTQTATYNIIEEYLGEITVPLLDNYIYNQDYCYKLYTQSGNSIRECTLEKIKTQNNNSNSITFYVPMSIGHAESRNLYIYSYSLNERLETNTQPDYIGTTSTLINPEWDFTDSNWQAVFNGNYFEDRDSKFRKFTNNTVTFTGYNFPPITLTAPKDKEIRGSIQTDKGFLYINNNTAYVIIKIYRKCKLKDIIIGPNETTDERGIKVTAGDFTTSLMYTNQKVEYKDIDIPNDSGEELELSFTITGNGGNIYYIKLTD